MHGSIDTCVAHPLRRFFPRAFFYSLAILVLLYLLPLQIQAASFYCFDAKTRIEKLICSNEEVSRLDEVLSDTYFRSLEVTPNKSEFRKTQKAWLFQRDACTDAACLTVKYRHRIDQLVQKNIALANGDRPDCFAKLNPYHEPYDVYFDGYIEPTSKPFGLSQNPVNFVGGEALPYKVIPLCNGKFVAMWSMVVRPRLGGSAAPTLRVFNAKLETIGADFRISASRKAEPGWHPNAEDISPLSNGNFVVVMKSIDKASTNEIHGQIYTSAGGEFGEKFEITTYGMEARIRPLRNGYFVVAWRGFNDVRMRVYDPAGLPFSSEIVALPGRSLNPYIHVTENERINIFVRKGWRLSNLMFSPIQGARSFSIKGEPVTPVLNSDQARELPGYQEVLEIVIKQQTHFLGRQMRSYLSRNGPIDCTTSKLQKDSVPNANHMLSLSKSDRMKAYIKRFCQRVREKCGTTGPLGEKLAVCLNS